MPVQLINFDDAGAKRELLSRLGALRGPYRVEVTRLRPRRTDRQNRWYWPAIVTPFAQYLSAQDYDVTSPEQAHAILKERFLRIEVVNKTTGEVIGQRVRSTTELSIEEFGDYCDRCAAWLSEFFGIVIQPGPGTERACHAAGRDAVDAERVRSDDERTDVLAQLRGVIEGA
jgi:hypothetical protein